MFLTEDRYDTIVLKIIFQIVFKSKSIVYYHLIIYFVIFSFLRTKTLLNKKFIFM